MVLSNTPSEAIAANPNTKWEFLKNAGGKIFIGR